MLEPQLRRKPVEQTPGTYSHSRTRTSSSNVFSTQPPHPMQPGPIPHHLTQPVQQHSRRSSSVNTISTSSSIPPPMAYRQSSVSDLQRSSSNRSGAASIQPQSGGYVALLRKQKATVWCDRAQNEDPRLLAQQRAAKKRANLEVVGGRAQGGAGGSRTNTGISATGKVAAKIRHHGKTPVVGLTPGENHVGVGGVPLRLSATEVEAESSDDDNSGVVGRSQHRRTGSSGRNSTASGRRAIPYRTSGGHGSLSGRRYSPIDTPERSGSLVDDRPLSFVGGPDDSASGKARSTRSGRSGSSAERADNVTELTAAPRLASKSLMNAALTREKSVKSPEELRRRGSVDERTATLTSQRLYIANPD